MKRHLTALAVCLSSATPAFGQEVIQNRWMGDATCGGWRSASGDYTSIQKSLLLNWVLGYLSGRAAALEVDLLADVEVSSVAAWLDDYCSANPLDYLVTAVFHLEKTLLARRGG